MDQLTGKVHLIPDQEDDREECFSQNHHSHNENGVFQDRFIQSFLYKKHTDNVTRNKPMKERPIASETFQTQIWIERFQNCSEILCRSGADMLEQEAIQLRQRLTSLVQQDPMISSVSLSNNKESKSCNHRKSPSVRYPDKSVRLIDRKNNSYDDGLVDDVSSKASSGPTALVSVQCETKKERSHYGLPVVSSTVNKSDKNKRKFEDTENEEPSNKEARLSNPTNLQQAEESTADDNDEDDDCLQDQEEEKAYILHRANRMKRIATLLCHMGKLHDSFLVEMMSSLNDEYLLSSSSRNA